jgi:hypothetical protein
MTSKKIVLNETDARVEIQQIKLPIYYCFNRIPQSPILQIVFNRTDSKMYIFFVVNLPYCYYNTKTNSTL